MRSYTVRRRYRKRKNSGRRVVAVVIILSIILGGFLLYEQPSSVTDTQPQPSVSAENIIEISSSIPWPQYGQAAYGVVDKGVLAVSDATEPAVPIASLAKVITALAILEHSPLQPGEQGPAITLTNEDVALYDEYISREGSVAPVREGQQMSQYDAMRAMLLSSANNVTDTVARWAFGSVEAYTIYANDMLRRHGFTETVVADASGFSPQTVSTTRELIQLGALYMRDPLLREIALQPHADIPVTGIVYNYNFTVNEAGVIGIKIGNTDEAGRCFLVADVREHTTSIVVVLGAEHIQIAMRDARTILDAGNIAYDQFVSQ